ncbi:hypothetical protein [Streptomyces sp. NPDC012888]|uniref:hypothetical protein n=1 Tax=Streptomyces sp. NPDC012888 TaxID=3364855 RepID=UPI0036A9A8CD
MGNGRRVLGAAAAGAVLASLALAAPAHAAGPAACKPAIRVLKALPGADPAEPSPWIEDNQVNGIGPLGLAVGVSHGKPAYWLGTTVFPVPLPAGYTGGRVEAVNRWGLMAGTLTGPGGSRAFAYRPWMPAVTLLPGGEQAADVNDKGRIVGQRHQPGVGAIGVEWSGGAVRRELALPPGFRLEGVTGINDAGQIVGHGDGPSPDPEDPYGISPGLLWPAEAGSLPTQLKPLGGNYESYRPEAVDSAGRVVGVFWNSRAMVDHATRWTPPYEDAHSVAHLAGRTSGSFEDISPTTNVSVGTASDSLYEYPPDEPPPVQAQYWPGSGPMKALPRLAPTGFSAAFTVTDKDQVGGVAVDAGGTERPVIWTCAAAQAYLPAP